MLMCTCCHVCAVRVVLAEVAWDGAPERVRAPVREGMMRVVVDVPE